MSVFVTFLFNSDSSNIKGLNLQNLIETGRYLKNLEPIFNIEDDWVKMFLLPQHKGIKKEFVFDKTSSDWLISIGTWFHKSGLASGAEKELLKRYLTTEVAQFANQLEGFFVLIIGNKKTRACTVITDIIGSAHAYFRKLKHGLAISSSSLLLAALEDYNPDITGCQEFLYTGTMYQDRTFYKEVHKLGPARIYQFNWEGIISERTYWQVSDLNPLLYQGANAVDALWQQLNNTVNRINRHFTNPVCDLTGGFDSRAIFAAWLNDGRPFKTTVSGNKESPDVQISSQLAELYQVEHIPLEMPDKITFADLSEALPLTDGEYDLIEYSGILHIHNFLSDNFDLSVNGSFGEIARGYWWELLFPKAGKKIPIDPFKLAMARYAYPVHDASIFSADTRIHVGQHFAQIIEEVNKGLSGLPNTMQMDNAYLNMRMQRWQGRIGSSTARIWHCLSPFMFKKLLEVMLQTDPQLRRRGLIIRKMLAKFQPQLAQFPLEHGYPAEPLSLKNFYRFYPLAEYYGKKVWSRLISKFGISAESTAPMNVPKSKRLQLWDLDEIQNILDIPSMQLTSLLDREALTIFIKNSKQDRFPFENQWNRLLTLELTLRKLKESATKLSV